MQASDIEKYLTELGMDAGGKV